MYARCGTIQKATEVFESLSVRNVVSWNAVISGYVHAKYSKDALNYYEQMHLEGISPDAVTFACMLKACGNIEALNAGENIQAEISRQRILNANVVVAGALVDMYAKSGAFVKAKRVLEGLAVQNIILWNALIAGYVNYGYDEEALSCFDCMQHEGLSPNAVTFICILKACGSIRAVEKGEWIHGEILKRRIFNVNHALGNALVNMYVKCDSLAKARAVLEGLSVRDVVSWSTLIAGYVEEGNAKEALICFERMQYEGILPDAVSFAHALKACGSIGTFEKGKDIHDEIIRQGLLGESIVLGNALVGMYAKCGALARAEMVREELAVEDAVSWNVIIAGYAHGRGQEALKIFEQMQQKCIYPNAVTFICILKVCGSIGALDKGKSIHLEIIRQGLLGENVDLGNALVDMYAKCHAFVKAKDVLEDLPVRNLVAWNALIAGYAQREYSKEAMNCFKEMLHEGLFPDAVTFSCILKACGSEGALDKGKDIHAGIVKQGLLDGNVVLGGALVDMYAKCGVLEKAREIVEELPCRNVVAWNALMGGYAQWEHSKDTVSCFQQMQCEGLFPDVVTFACMLKACGNIGDLDKGENIYFEIISQALLDSNAVHRNTLLDMYTKCGALAKAKEVLEGLPVRDVVSWSVLMAGYIQGDFIEEALNCCEQMQREGISPNSVTFICILKACGKVGALDKGGDTHSELIKQGLLSGNIALGNALVDMYAKCGALVRAKEILEMLPLRDMVSWNTLFSGYAHKGYVMEVLICFEWMQCEGLYPDEITFVCVLNACTHLGLLNTGYDYFSRMMLDYHIAPDPEHYGCIVNLFARVGFLDKAITVLKKMPFSNHCPAWLALLTACESWGNEELAKWAFDYVIQSNGETVASHISDDVVSGFKRSKSIWLVPD